jgi:hypothetical protein
LAGATTWLPTRRSWIDQDVLGTALDDLVTRKPHPASRRPAGDVDQGAREAAEGVSLAGLLRAGAG